MAAIESIRLKPKPFIWKIPILTNITLFWFTIYQIFWKYNAITMTLIFIENWLNKFNNIIQCQCFFKGKKLWESIFIISKLWKIIYVNATFLTNKRCYFIINSAILKIPPNEVKHLTASKTLLNSSPLSDLICNCLQPIKVLNESSSN